MGIPIAIGTKSVSSYPVTVPVPIEEFADDGTVLLPVPVTWAGPLVVLAASRDQQWQATVTIHYYDMMRENDSHYREYTVAELHVQIGPAGNAFSTRYRETLHRLVLPASSSLPEEINDAVPIESALTPPIADFSSDGRFLACLIPHPWARRQTSVAVFQLRRPVTTSTSSTRASPALPSYISQPASAKETVVPVTTNPRILFLPNRQPFLDATSLCSTTTTTTTAVPTAKYTATSVSPPPLLLVGCRSGSLMVASYRAVTANELVGSATFTDRPAVVALQYCNSVADETTGRLVAIRETGSATVYSTTLQTMLPTELSRTSFTTVQVGDYSFGLQEVPLWELNGPFVAAQWITASHLALMEPATAAACVVRVWALADGAATKPVATLPVTPNGLSENAHTTFVLDSSVAATDDDDEGGRRLWFYGTIGMEYDSYSDCIAISSALIKVGTDNGSVIGCTVEEVKPFVCLWNWRTNIEGLTVALSRTHKVLHASGQSLISRLFFVKDTRGNRNIAHGIASVGQRSCRIRKELYETAILSPPADTCFGGTRIRQSNSLLLSSSSVSYPHVSLASVTGDFEIEWRESSIPLGYLLACGPPVIATTGKRWSRCIAVAAERGICSLNCSTDTDPTRKLLGRNEIEQSSAAKLEGKRPTRTHPKWHLFGNEAEEKSFRVVAMNWWEGCDTIGGEIDEKYFDDILVAVIEVLEGTDQGYYLSSWSHRMLDANHQLLLPASVSILRSPWGIRLPDSFSPTCLDVLDMPKSRDTLGRGSASRKAVVVVADSSADTQYRVFQLQVFPRMSGNATSYAERKSYVAVAKLATRGKLGYAASILLASASFEFDLHPRRLESYPGDNSDSYVATFGAIDSWVGGIDAVVASTNGIMSTKQLFETSSELTSYWLADIVNEGRSVSLAWVLQLADGRLLCWVVPCICDDIEQGGSRPSLSVPDANHTDSAEAFLPNAALLGKICSAGSTSTWMQQSSTATKNELSLGCVPGSCFGCILMAGQSCRKLHRSLRDDLDRELFRFDFLEHDLLGPTDFVLSPPAYIASLFSGMLDNVGTGVTLIKEINEETLSRRNILPRLGADPFHDSIMMALQLLILRSVEKVATTSSNGGVRTSRDLFCAVVDCVATTTTPFQFATMFVEVGRQIEPSFLPSLFPLPVSLVNGGGNCSTTDDIFDLLLEYGSMSLPVATLPLFVERDTTRSSCAAIFHHCLDALDASGGTGSATGFDLLREERSLIGDIFRYGLKLEGPDDEGDMTRSLSTDSVASEDEPRGYSLMCGISRLFSGGKRRQKMNEQAIVNAASSFIVHGFDEYMVEEHLDVVEPIDANSSHRQLKYDGHTGYDTSPGIKSQTVAGVAARYLLAIVSNQNFKGASGWLLGGEMASLLIGESMTGFYACSRHEFMDLAHQLKSSDLRALLPVNQRRKGGFVAYLVHNIQKCEQDIDSTRASKMLDLLLILLARQAESRDFAAETPGLIVAAVVVGHASGRITDLLSDDADSPIPLFSQYLEARFELAKRESAL